MKILRTKILIFSLIFSKSILSADISESSSLICNEEDTKYIDQVFQITKESQAKALIDKAILDVFIKSNYCEKYKDYIEFGSDILDEVGIDNWMRVGVYGWEKVKFYFNNRVTEKAKLELLIKFFGIY